MRVARLHGVRDLRLEELPRPTPGSGEVLLRVASVGVCGSDVHYYLHGRIGSQVVTGPIIMGHEFSAWVSELGAGVEGPEIGRLVAVDPAISCGQCEPCRQGHPNLCPGVRFCGTPPIDGVFAEYTVMPAANCFPLPDGFDPAAGALLEPLGIALHAVDLARLKPGQTVAVLGAGPIGLLIAAVARAAGATAIYMTEPLADRRRFALNYAADAVLDPGEANVANEILRLTGGRGVDVAFEAAGAPETPQQAAAVVRIGGKVIVAGIPADDTMTLNAGTVRRKGLTIKLVRRMKHTYPRAISLVQTGRVDVRSLATHFFPLERIAEAFELVASYQDGVLRAVIEVSA
jgi:L-iditol 2-dehydrogenase